MLAWIPTLSFDKTGLQTSTRHIRHIFFPLASIIRLSFVKFIELRLYQSFQFKQLKLT